MEGRPVGEYILLVQGSARPGAWCKCVVAGRHHRKYQGVCVGSRDADRWAFTSGLGYAGVIQGAGVSRGGVAAGDVHPHIHRIIILDIDVIGCPDRRRQHVIHFAGCFCDPRQALDLVHRNPVVGGRSTRALCHPRIAYCHDQHFGICPARKSGGALCRRFGQVFRRPTFTGIVGERHYKNSSTLPQPGTSSASVQPRQLRLSRN